MLDLADSRSRVERARRSFAVTQPAAQKWFEEEVELHIHVIDNVWRVIASPKSIPTHLLLDLGDIFVQLHAALDYIAFKLFLSSGGDSTSKKAKGIYFPNTDTEEAFAAAIARLGGASPQVIGALRASQSFAANAPTPHPLRFIQGMDNAAKHRHIHLAAVSTSAIEWKVLELPPKGSTWDVRMFDPAIMSSTDDGWPRAEIAIRGTDGRPLMTPPILTLVEPLQMQESLAISGADLMCGVAAVGSLIDYTDQVVESVGLSSK